MVSLDELLRASDYVLVNCPLTPQTRGLLGKPQFALMKPDAVLINTARGPIVDEAALIDALQSGQIAGAALDVFEKRTAQRRFAAGSHGECHPQFALHRLDRGAIPRYGAHRCQGALAVYRGEAPQHVVNPQVLSSPAFLQNLKDTKLPLQQGGR
jgi:lactate dehydrogenase-like 2-hydroxyacid dehydrogenase